MLLHNTSNSAYVDMADGYSFLPFVEPKIVALGSKWTPEDISVIIHEFTHQFALKGPFGYLCAYHQVMRAQVNELAKIEEIGRSLLDQPSRNKCDFSSTLSWFCSDDLANCTDLFTIFRYWLEGIAMFAQLDFSISNQYETNSAIFDLLLAVWNSDLHRHDQENPICTDSQDLEGMLNEVGPRLASVADITELMQVVKLSQFRGLRRLFLTCSDPAHAPYFVGYLLVRRIQRLLGNKDSRLADPEIFFIFINSYLFFDAALLDLCRTLPRAEYQARISEHLRAKVQLLMDVSVERLRLIVDALCDHESADVNFAHLDVAASLRLGRLMSWTSLPMNDIITSGIIEALHKRCSCNRAVFCRRMISKENAFIQHVLDSSIDLMTTLSIAMKYFKFHHGFMGVLGCNVNEDDCRLTWQALDRSCVMLGESIPRTAGIELLKIAQENSFEVARDTKLPASISAAFVKYGLDAIHRGMHLLRKEGKLLMLEFFEAYSLLSNQRLHIRFRDSFYHVRSYCQKSGLNGEWEDVSQEEADMLKEARGYLSPSNYYERINLPHEIIQQHAKIDHGYAINDSIRWWRQLFPEAQATDSDLLRLAEQKLGLLCLQLEDRSLIDALCEAATTHASVEYLAASERLNRRWRHYTGEALIQPVKEDCSQLIFSL